MTNKKGIIVVNRLGIILALLYAFPAYPADVDESPSTSRTGDVYFYYHFGSESEILSIYQLNIIDGEAKLICSERGEKKSRILDNGLKLLMFWENPKGYGNNYPERDLLIRIYTRATNGEPFTVYKEYSYDLKPEHVSTIIDPETDLIYLDYTAGHVDACDPHPDTKSYIEELAITGDRVIKRREISLPGFILGGFAGDYAFYYPSKIVGCLYRQPRSQLMTGIEPERIVRFRPGSWPLGIGIGGEFVIFGRYSKDARYYEICKYHFRNNQTEGRRELIASWASGWRIEPNGGCYCGPETYPDTVFEFTGIKNPNADEYLVRGTSVNATKRIENKLYIIPGENGPLLIREDIGIQIPDFYNLKFIDWLP